MNQHDVVQNLARARPSCIVNLDNEHLSQEMGMKFNDFYGYKKGSTTNLKPDVYLLTNTVRHSSPEHMDVFNHAFYTLALPQINKRYFSFPSDYIGQYGAYDAIKYVFTEGGLPHLVKDHSLFLARDNALYDIEEARLKVAQKFKEKHGISQNSTVVFFAPGNSIGESEFSLEDFRKGYNEFISKYSYPSSLSSNAPPKENFKLVVSVHKNSEAENTIRDFMLNSSFETEVIFVSDEDNSHYAGMCASDFGFVYNGQMVSSAAALHLHCVTMQDMNDLHYFWHSWENRWLADINHNADRPLIPEFVAGEYWFGKIASHLGDMHTNAEARWDQVRNCRPFINELLSIKAVDRHSRPERDPRFIEGDRTVYDEFEDPIFLMTRKIHSSMTNYRNVFSIKPDLSIIKPIPSLTLNNSLSTPI